MIFEYPEGATPIDEEERTALIPGHIKTQRQLNAYEQLNISQSLVWAGKQKNILTVSFLRNLHKSMFDKTWRWAGKFRTTQKNIGMESYRIETELCLLCDDVKFQLDNKSFGMNETVVRFHHRLVFIHAFPNGNGRHARLAADLLMKRLGDTPFSWGSKKYNHNDLSSLTEMRKEYINALRKADQHAYKDLILFANS